MHGLGPHSKPPAGICAARGGTERTRSVVTVIAALCMAFGSVTVCNPAQALARAAACTHTITPDVTVVDGNDTFAGVEPGDVLCVPAGVRSSFEVRNLRGKAGAPITIRNDGGQVRVQGGPFRHGITLENNAYLRLTGTGVAAQCGAPYAVDEQQCGFVVSGFAKAVDAVNNATDLEFDHIEATECSEAAFKIKGDGKNIANQKVHHLYAHDVAEEGLYLGEAGNDQSLDVVRGLEASHNLVVRSGWDAINVKHTANQVRVHHNIIHDSGRLGVTHQDQGLSIGAGGSGDYYNNQIINTYGPGLNIRTLPAGSKIYNNVIVDSGAEGIYYNNGAGVSFFNNTLVNNRGGGIVATPRAAGTAFDNIVVGSPAAIQGVADRNNFTGSLAAARFVDAAAHDYRLRSDSPLIDGGRNSGMFPAVDMVDLKRPHGAKTDLGAYEFRGDPAPRAAPWFAWPELQTMLIVVLLGVISMLVFVQRSHVLRPYRPYRPYHTTTNRWRKHG